VAQEERTKMEDKYKTYTTGLEAMVAQLRHEVAEKDGLLSRQSAAMASQDSTIASLTAAFSDLEGQLARLEKEKANLSHEVTHLGQQKQQQVGETAEAAAKVRHLEKALAEAGQVGEAHEVAAEKSQAQNAALQSKMFELESKSSAFEDVAARCSQLEKEKTKLCDQVALAKAQGAELGGQMTALDGDLRHAKEKIFQLSLANEALEVDVANKQGELDNNRSQLRQNQDLQAKLGTTILDAAQMLIEHAAATKKVSPLQVKSFSHPQTTASPVTSQPKFESPPATPPRRSSCGT